MLRQSFFWTALAALTISFGASGADLDAKAWPFVGGSIQNTRSANMEHLIGADNVARLAPVWTTQLKGAVKSATPVSDGQSIFLPTATGLVYQIDRKTGQVTREIDLPKLLDVPGAFSKASLAVSGNLLVVGLQNHPIVAGLDKTTGELLWKVTIDDHPGAVVTQSPLIVGNRIFIGVSGLGEEVSATTASYQCCSFRGSELALDAGSGKILWKTHTIPEGYAGASVWSNAATYDAKRHALYITTGNEFHVPDDVQKCADKNKNNMTALAACYPAGIWYDSILSLNPDTGAIKWGHRFENYDIFTGACLVPENHAEAHCGNGLDFDFGNGAMLWHEQGSNGRDLLGAGQKSGMFWALNPDNGEIVWKRHLGPGGPVGGVEFGSATDSNRVYAAEANTKGVGHDAGTYTLPSGQTIKYGSFAAMEGATGKVLWQVPDPAGVKFPGNDISCKVNSPKENCAGAFPRAAVTVANGVLYGCSEEPEGHMYAFDAASGALLWSFKSGAKCSAGASIIDGTVYWASGQTLYAFAVSTGGATKEVVNNVGLPTANDNGRTVWSGIYASAQAARGREIYLRSCAAGCHLSNLGGSGPAPDLAGHDFLTRWNGLSVADLLKKIRTTMPKVAPGSLSANDYLAVTAYLFSENKFPAGQRDLQADEASLGRTKIAVRQ